MRENEHKLLRALLMARAGYQALAESENSAIALFAKERIDEIEEALPEGLRLEKAVER